jgi:cell wall assembly regulator SMI1
MITEQLKPIIYWVGIGASLIVYAHANFATKERVEENTAKLESVATVKDIDRVEKKLDDLTRYLLENK